MLLYVDPFVRLLGKWSENITIGSIFLRMALAFIMGMVLGLDRSIKRHPAGLRTCTLVALAAAVCMLLNKNSINSDSVRLAAGIVTGIGFLGAGTIVVTKRNRIKGLTTAAVILMSAVLGLAAGAGFYLVSIVGFLMAILTINGLPLIERNVQKKSKVFDIHIELDAKENVKALLGYLRDSGVRVLDLTLDHAFEGTGLGVYTIVLSLGNTKKSSAELANDMKMLEYVRYVEIM